MIESSDTHAVFAIYCNKQLLDGGDPCMGIYQLEIHEICRIITLYC